MKTFKLTTIAAVCGLMGCVLAGCSDRRPSNGHDIAPTPLFSAPGTSSARAAKADSDTLWLIRPQNPDYLPRLAYGRSKKTGRTVRARLQLHKAFADSTGAERDSLVTADVDIDEADTAAIGYSMAMHNAIIYYRDTTDRFQRLKAEKVMYFKLELDKIPYADGTQDPD